MSQTRGEVQLIGEEDNLNLGQNAGVYLIKGGVSMMKLIVIQDTYRR